MGTEENYRWIGPDKKVKDLTDKEIIEINLFKLISPYLTVLTRYFPFSLLWRDRRFHFRFKEITEADDRIIAIASKKGFWFKLFSFEREERFFIIYGQFIPEKKKADEKKLIEHFEKEFENENIYISKPDAKTVKISFLKNR